VDDVLLAVFANEQAAVDARSRLLSAGFSEAAVAFTDRDGRAASTDRSGLTVRVTSEAELERAEQALESASTQALPVLEEQLDIGRQPISRGTVRVSSRVVETPVEETVRLDEEHATVERRDADRPATATDLAAFEAGVLEVRDMVELAVVRKSAHVVEEVVITKRIVRREQVVRDTVRRTQIEVQRVAPAAREPETHR
jgi:uncharacterized protein (TIGR02271 family)